ncbi:hypothetical protein PVAP13_6NG330950 [Panicum virgatum]|uniref:Uncharacterized protein n=1 Tax=Panicum virgatum TaxID=38727 RepID=A0A8T0R4N9_PANVG|nr:hypothetical protein PVAP13_6NG330950 [Panicum virgatum]
MRRPSPPPARTASGRTCRRRRGRTARRATGRGAPAPTTTPRATPCTRRESTGNPRRRAGGARPRRAPRRGARPTAATRHPRLDPCRLWCRSTTRGRKGLVLWFLYAHGVVQSLETGIITFIRIRILLEIK